MTAAEYRHALCLLDSAHALLERRTVPNDELRTELRRLVQALDRLRVQIGQVPAESRRN